MGTCFSCFKQLFASGQTFTYDLAGIGYYYRDYVKLMDHWDEVLGQAGYIAFNTRLWSMTLNPRFDDCWSIADSSLRNSVCGFMRRNAPCEHRAPSRFGNLCIRTDLNSGETMKHTSIL